MSQTPLNTDGPSFHVSEPQDTVGTPIHETVFAPNKVYPADTVIYTQGNGTQAFSTVAAPMHNFLKEVTIYVTFQREGVHAYPEAATSELLATGGWDDVSFLAVPHRHMFHFKVAMTVTHNNRDVEFIQLKRTLERMYTGSVLKLDNKSCEMIASDLIDELVKLYGVNRTYTVEVSEDGENGAIVKYSHLWTSHYSPHVM